MVFKFHECEFFEKIAENFLMELEFHELEYRLKISKIFNGTIENLS